MTKQEYDEQITKWIRYGNCGVNSCDARCREFIAKTEIEKLIEAAKKDGFNYELLKTRQVRVKYHK